MSALLVSWWTDATRYGIVSGLHVTSKAIHSVTWSRWKIAGCVGFSTDDFAGSSVLLTSAGSALFAGTR
jgi:hypothetical protein